MKSNGWSFGWTDAYTFWNKEQSGTYCKGVPKTSYCGWRSPGDGIVSFLFTSSGSAALYYGQSWNFGSIQIKLKGKEIAKISSIGSSITTFDFVSDDVLEIVELEGS